MGRDGWRGQQAPALTLHPRHTTGLFGHGMGLYSPFTSPSASRWICFNSKPNFSLWLPEAVWPGSAPGSHHSPVPVPPAALCHWPLPMSLLLISPCGLT